MSIRYNHHSVEKKWKRNLENWPGDYFMDYGADCLNMACHFPGSDSKKLLENFQGKFLKNISGSSSERLSKNISGNSSGEFSEDISEIFSEDDLDGLARFQDRIWRAALRIYALEENQTGYYMGNDAELKHACIARMENASFQKTGEDEPADANLIKKGNAESDNTYLIENGKKESAGANLMKKGNAESDNVDLIENGKKESAGANLMKKEKDELPGADLYEKCRILHANFLYDYLENKNSGGADRSIALLMKYSHELARASEMVTCAINDTKSFRALKDFWHDYLYFLFQYAPNMALELWEMLGISKTDHFAKEALNTERLDREASITDRLNREDLITDRLNREAFAAAHSYVEVSDESGGLEKMNCPELRDDLKTLVTRTLPIQLDKKIRGHIAVKVFDEPEKIIQAAEDYLKEQLAGKKVIREIYIRGRIISLHTA